MPTMTELVFSHLAEADLATCARVCQDWSEVALACLWKNINFIYYLLKLAGPFGPSHSIGYVYDTPCLSDTDFTRFIHYSHRVHSINWDDDGGPDDHMLSTDALLKLHHKLSSTSCKFLLPKLRLLKWKSDHNSTVQLPMYLIPKTLQELDLEFGDDVTFSSSDAAVENMIASIPGFVPNLKSLRLFSPVSSWAPEILGTLAITVACLPKLTSLLLPTVDIADSFIRALSSCTSLRVLDIKQSFTVKLDVVLLTKAIAATFPLLESLTLRLPKKSVNHTLEFDSIAALRSCSNLTHLNVLHPCPMILYEPEIRCMGKAWRKMTTLHLCANVTQATSAGTSASMLQVFAASFSPTLQKVALYISFSSSLPSSDAVTASFPNLQVLGVGSSLVPNGMEVEAAEFLGAVLPPGVQITCTQGKDYAKSPFKSSSKLRGNWAEVVEGMKMVHRIQQGVLRRLGGSSP